MPELPEVETMRRGVLAVEGCRIERLELPRRQDVKPLTLEPTARAFQRRAKGRTIERVGRAGKRLVFELDGGERIVFEPRMTGLALLTDPPTTKHLRARFELSGGEVDELLLWDRRGLGTLRLLDEEAYAEAVSAKLGPDALELTPEDLPERLGRSRRAVKVALLDQAIVAGIGNIYAAEALFVAKVDPRRECSDLSRAEWRRLRQALLDVLEEAIRYEGSTLGDGTYRNALNQDGSYQSCHRVYARTGERCGRKRCRGVVERVVLGQRATFFCPECQG